MNIISKSIKQLVSASSGDPATTTIVVMLFALMFNVLLASIETVLYGGRFAHWLDPLFIAVFIVYAARAVIACDDYKKDLAENEPKNP
jgi:hypothetical protein